MAEVFAQRQLRKFILVSVIDEPPYTITVIFTDFLVGSERFSERKPTLAIILKKK